MKTIRMIQWGLLAVILFSLFLPWYGFEHFTVRGFSLFRLSYLLKHLVFQTDINKGLDFIPFIPFLIYLTPLIFLIGLLKSRLFDLMSIFLSSVLILIQCSLLFNRSYQSQLFRTGLFLSGVSAVILLAVTLFKKKKDFSLFLKKEGVYAYLIFVPFAWILLFTSPHAFPKLSLDPLIRTSRSDLVDLYGGIQNYSKVYSIDIHSFSISTLYEECRKFPKIRETFFDPVNFVDPWGNIYQAEPYSGTLMLRSLGPNGISGDSDDIALIPR